MHRRLTVVGLDEVLVNVKHLSGGLHGLRVGGRGLEVKVVVALAVELGRGDIGTNQHLALVAGKLDGLGKKLNTLLVVLQVGGKATLVTDTGGYPKESAWPQTSIFPAQHTVSTVLLLDQSLEDLVDLSTVAHGLGEVRGANGQDHVLLEGKTVAGVLATVDDVERGDREGELARVSSKVGNVAVERDAL